MTQGKHIVSGHLTSIADRYGAWLFWAAVGALLLPIWLNAYFLTGDGPCHVYNARVLLDWWLGRDRSFYGEYYELNRLIVPNQFVHWVLALLQLVLPGVVAEKVLYSLYVVAFAGGMRQLLRAIHPGGGFLVFSALAFMMGRPFVMGFINYSFSIAGVLLLTAFWLRRRAAPSLSVAAWLSAGLLLEYLMHPIGIGLTLVTLLMCSLGALLLAGRPISWQAAIMQFWQELLLLGLAALPAVVLLLVYLMQVEGGTIPSLLTNAERWQAFWHQEALIGLNEQEATWTMALAFGLFGMVAAAMVLRVARAPRRIYPSDAFLLLSLLLLYVYFRAPEGGVGGSILLIRLQYLPLLLLIPWLATAPWPLWGRAIITLFGLVITGALLALRWPIQQQIAQAEADYLSIAAHIAPHSTVLPLSYNHNGQIPGVPHIPARAWLFVHAADYLGAMRPPLVMLGNYEANTGTFPMRWIWERNPFGFLSTREGQENMPPSVDLHNYEQHGGKIDYVLLWGARDNFANHPYSQEMRAVLTRDYKRIAVSPLGYAELFEKRNRRIWDAW